MSLSHEAVATAEFPVAETEASRGLPSYVVGQDGQGRWIALESHGLGGGYFRNREAAFHYAVSQTGRRAGAVRLSAEPLRIALEDCPLRAAGLSAPPPPPAPRA